MSGRFTCEQVARAALGEPVRCVGSELLYRCPQSERHANGDVHPSLKVNPKKDTWGCFVCGVCGTAWALAALIAGSEPSDKRAVTAWLRERGLLNGKHPEASNAKREHADDGNAQIIAEYNYTDEAGGLLFQVVRLEPKKFRQRRPDGHGGWIWNLDGTRRVLYRLPEVLAETHVLICEGEKDCDIAHKMGIVATCNPAGAGKWSEVFSECMRGKKLVAIIPDSDEPGRKHAKQVAHSLFGKVESLKMLELPEVKDFSEWAERGGTKDALWESIRNTPQWKPECVEGARLLDQVADYIRRFVSLSEFQAWVSAVWIIHTYAFDAADATPYLAITSAEKQSGKTRLLEVFHTLVANPWFTGRVTAAVLTRKIDRDRPSLLLDESDAAFGGEKEYAEALRGILNTGHRCGGTASSCVGQGANITFKDFSTFCPKAIAGIGKLPDTVADRAVRIRLKRAAQGEKVERFRSRDVDSEARKLKSQIEAWCNGFIFTLLREMRPQLPEELTDRQQDGAEPLLAIADLAGGGWPRKIRQALIVLCTEARADDGSIGVRLLNDIREIFLSRQLDMIYSADLVASLCEIETSPWTECSKGKPLSAGKLASYLRPFDVAPHNIRIGETVKKGYTRGDFADAWQRYLSPIGAYEEAQSATAATSIVLSEISARQGATEGERVAPEKPPKPAPKGPCSGVAAPSPLTRDKQLVEVEV